MQIVDNIESRYDKGKSMKAFIIPLLFCSHFVLANEAPVPKRFQCDEGQSFTIQMTSHDAIQLQVGWSFIPLPQVVAASGVKYSDGKTTVWLKGDTGFLEQNDVVVAKNCTLADIEEPLRPVRDAASGLVFIPPDRWTANRVQMDVKSGSEIPFYGESATQQFEYRFRAGAAQQKYPLLDILVFPKAAWTQLAADKKPIGEVLGEDGQRVYVAQLPANNPFDPASSEGKEFIALQTNSKEVQQAFSIYGIVKKQAVESVTAKVMWLDRRLYPGAVLTVELRDVSLMDAPAELIAKQTITLEQGTPPTVTLKFSPDAINPRNTYAIGARLEMDGKLIKINDTHTPVLTRGAGCEVTVILKNL